MSPKNSMKFKKNRYWFEKQIKRSESKNIKNKKKMAK